MKTTEYTIKHAAPSDIHQIIDFYLKEISIESSYKTIEETILFHLEATKRKPPTQIMIACMDNDILGLSIAYFSHTVETYEVECTTAKYCRRRGIAYSLILSTVMECQRNGYFNFQANILPENEKSIKMIQKLGFKLTPITLSSRHQTYRLSTYSSILK